MTTRGEASLCVEEREGIWQGVDVEEAHEQVSEALRRELTELHERVTQDQCVGENEAARRLAFLESLATLTERAPTSTEAAEEVVERLRQSDRVLVDWAALEREVVRRFALHDEESAESVRATAQTLAEELPAQLRALRDEMSRAPEAQRFELVERQAALVAERDHYERLTAVLDQSIAYQTRLLAGRLVEIRQDVLALRESTDRVHELLVQRWEWQSPAMELQTKSMCKDALDSGLMSVVEALSGPDTVVCAEVIQQAMTAVDGLRLAIEQAAAEEQRVARAAQMESMAEIPPSVEEAARVLRAAVRPELVAGESTGHRADAHVFLPPGGTEGRASPSRSDGIELGADDAADVRVGLHRIVVTDEMRARLENERGGPTVGLPPEHGIRLEELERQRDLLVRQLDAARGPFLGAVGYQLTLMRTGEVEEALAVADALNAIFRFMGRHAEAVSRSLPTPVEAARRIEDRPGPRR